MGGNFFYFFLYDTFRICFWKIIYSLWTGDVRWKAFFLNYLFIYVIFIFLKNFIKCWSLAVTSTEINTLELKGGKQRVQDSSSNMFYILLFHIKISFAWPKLIKIFFVYYSFENSFLKFVGKEFEIFLLFYTGFVQWGSNIIIKIV